MPYADGMLVPLPEGLDPAVAASIADNVCDGYRHVAPHLPELLRRQRGSARSPGRAERHRAGRSVQQRRRAVPDRAPAHRAALRPHEPVTSGRLRPEEVTTCRGRIDDAPQVLREHVRGDGVKTILTED